MYFIIFLFCLEKKNPSSLIYVFIVWGTIDQQKKRKIQRKSILKWQWHNLYPGNNFLKFQPQILSQSSQRTQSRRLSNPDCLPQIIIQLIFMNLSLPHTLLRSRAGRTAFFCDFSPSFLPSHLFFSLFSGTSGRREAL